MKKQYLKSRFNSLKHGDTGVLGNKRLYRIFMKMHYRCYNPKSSFYSYYGGKGIKICDSWYKNYIAFKSWAIKNEYKNTLSINRIDNNKGYAPSNCNWATTKEQARNKTNNVIFKKENAIDASLRLGGSKNLVFNRIRMLNWSKEKAFTTTARIKVW